MPRRLAAPRFFRQGDETVLRVIAHNYLATAKKVTFALDADGVSMLSGQSRTILIPARGESYVDWRVKALQTGNAVITAKALTNQESDAVQMTLPVLAYGVRRRAVGSGVLFSGNGQSQWQYTFPASSDAGTRKLTITVAPSVAGTVFDALQYLASYPWGCTEQTMSSFLPDLTVAQAAHVDDRRGAALEGGLPGIKPGSTSPRALCGAGSYFAMFSMMAPANSLVPSF